MKNYEIPTIDQFIKKGEQKGSNPGGTYTNKQGEEYYLKFPAQKVSEGEEMAKNEVLAAKLYELAGVKVPELSLIKDKNGKLGIASKIEPTFQSAQNPDAELFHDKSSAPRSDVKWDELPGVQEGLAADAWLANWDVVGLEYDNLGTHIDPQTGQLEAFRLDTGGALIFRAQGGLKGKFFSNEVTEIDSLRGKNPNVQNDQAKTIFGNASDAKLKEGAQKIANIDDKKIQETVMQYGPGTEKERKELALKLIERKKYLIKRFQIGLQNIEPTVEEILEFNAKSAAQYEDSVMNGVKFAPATMEVAEQGINPNIKEQPMNIPSGKAQAAGVIIVENDGRVWVYEPKNHFGGYHHTFPKADQMKIIPYNKQP